MTNADKRRRAEELALAAVSKSIGERNLILQARVATAMADTLMQFASELEAAAIERCEKVLRDMAEKSDKEWNNEANEIPETAFSINFVPPVVRVCADAIAKLKESQ